MTNQTNRVTNHDATTRPDRAPALWVRHRAAQFWCIAVESDASIVTLCRGRFNASDDYAVDIDPPAQTRCVACERDRVVESARSHPTPIEAALAELANHAPARLEWDAIDEGGEA